MADYRDFGNLVGDDSFPINNPNINVETRDKT